MDESFNSWDTVVGDGPTNDDQTSPDQWLKNWSPLLLDVWLRYKAHCDCASTDTVLVGGRGNQDVPISVSIQFHVVLCAFSVCLL